MEIAATQNSMNAEQKQTKILEEKTSLPIQKSYKNGFQVFQNQKN